jgi:putative FmdB family regulatory protein
MPIYEYNCPGCREKFELLRPLSKCGDDAECPKCQGSAKRALSRFISKSATDLSFLDHMPAGNGDGEGSSCGSCSSSSCSTCGK